MAFSRLKLPHEVSHTGLDFCRERSSRSLPTLDSSSKRFKSTVESKANLELAGNGYDDGSSEFSLKYCNLAWDEFSSKLCCGKRAILNLITSANSILITTSGTGLLKRFSYQNACNHILLAATGKSEPLQELQSCSDMVPAW